MKSWILAILACFGIILFAGILGFATDAISFASFKFWAPKVEAVHREVFVNTPSYVESRRQALVKYHHEWNMAKDSADKAAIESVVRQEFANVDKNYFTDPDQYSFLMSCMNK